MTTDSNFLSTPFSRRQLLKGGAGAAAGAALAAYLPSSVRRAIAGAAPTSFDLSQVKHVVLLMQENRSFDHYFGTLPGVRGFGDPRAMRLPNGRSVFAQPDPDNPDAYLLPYHLDTSNSSAQAVPSLSHAWQVQHSSWSNGDMDGWLRSHIASDSDTNGPFTMGYYTANDIPFQYALANAFTICDNYFCSILGTDPSQPLHVDDRDGRSQRAGRRPGAGQQRAERHLQLDHLRRTAAERRHLVEVLPAGGQLRHQRARVLQPVHRRADVVEPVPERVRRQHAPERAARQRPDHGLRGGLRQRHPADGQLALPDQRGLGAPVVPAGRRRAVRGLEDRGAGRQRGPVELDRVHPELRRERRLLRPRAARSRRRRARRTSSPPELAGRHAGRRAQPRFGLPGARHRDLALDGRRLRLLRRRSTTRRCCVSSSR